ncbi:MAG: cytidylate kinase family protein [Patescibacteria group bacterium]
MAKITIFGMAGTGKSSTGQEIAKRLGYEYHSHGGFFRETAARLGITLNELDELSKTDSSTDIECDKTIAELGKNHDGIVVEGRLAWYFIPDSFKVCLKCDFETRTKRIADREKKDLVQVQSETKERESAIYERFNRYYGITNFEDEKNFDLVIDTASLNFEQVVETIINNLKDRKII